MTSTPLKPTSSTIIDLPLESGEDELILQPGENSIPTPVLSLASVPGRPISRSLRHANRLVYHNIQDYVREELFSLLTPENRARWLSHPWYVARNSLVLVFLQRCGALTQLLNFNSRFKMLGSRS